MFSFSLSPIFELFCWAVFANLIGLCAEESFLYTQLNRRKHRGFEKSSKSSSICAWCRILTYHEMERLEKEDGADVLK